MLKGIHHVAIICADYTRSRYFYTEVLGCKIIAENYRKDRDSWKLDLELDGGSRIELFSFANAPQRLSYPEATGLRHLAFRVADIEAAVNKLAAHDITPEAIRMDEYTGKKFTFFSDPDGLPLELYEM
jgi:glyoxylase I family protein